MEGNREAVFIRLLRNFKAKLLFIRCLINCSLNNCGLVTLYLKKNLFMKQHKGTLWLSLAFVE